MRVPHVKFHRGCVASVRGQLPVRRRANTAVGFRAPAGPTRQPVAVAMSSNSVAISIYIIICAVVSMGALILLPRAAHALAATTPKAVGEAA